MGFLNGLHAKAAFWKRSELAMILEEFLRPDALHDLDGFDDVLVPSLVNVRRTRGLELLRHPAGSDSYVDPAARKVIPCPDLSRQDSRGPIGCVDYAYSEPDLL